MKIVRVLYNSGPRYGTLLDDGQVAVFAGDPFNGLGEPIDRITTADFMAPVQGRCVIGIGLNYRDHAHETGAKIPEHPVVFFKNPGSVVASGGSIKLPVNLKSTKVDFEAELAVVIGKKAVNVSRANAMDYVLGFTCANDVSARDWQKEWGGSQWSRGKSFDSFCPLGPWIVTPDEIGDPQNLRVQTKINGELMQDGNTSDMIFSVSELIEFLTGDTTLLPGTVILTGTPAGVGAARTPPRFLVAGDKVEVEIGGIGVLSNLVA